MKAGRLNDYVTLQSYLPVQDSQTGAISSTWSNFASVFASVESLTATEYLLAQQEKSTISSRVVIRYMAGLVPSMRILHDSHTYEIEGILPDKRNGREYLVLMVSEVQHG